MASEDKELEEQLREAGNKLLDPPPSVEELLPLLNQVENCLSKVEQSPTDTMQLALAPSLRALIADKLFQHQDVDVKVAVASCISEITRITAPEAPYNDDQMKDVFQLIVSSFEKLDDKSSPSYVRRTMILDIVAKVRSCVVMLDLECDALIVEMFQLFLNLIRDYHPENVFSSMETIMTLVLEESEEISVELLSPLLATLKLDNKDVLPIAWKLGEKVLNNCASKVEPYLANAVKSLGISVEDYSGVVASICPKLSLPVESNDGHAADENNVGAASEEAAEADRDMVVEAAPDNKVEPTSDDTLNAVVTDEVPQLGEDEKLVHSTSLKSTDEEGHRDQEKHTDSSTNAEPKNLDSETTKEADNNLENTAKKEGSKVNITKPSTNAEPKYLDSETTKEADNNLEYTAKKKGSKVIITKRRVEPADSSQTDGVKTEKLVDDKSNVENISSLPCPDQPEEAASENKEMGTEASLPKAVGSDSGKFVSLTVSENLRDESLSKVAPRSKKKGRLIKDSAPSSDAGPEMASEAVTDSDAEPQKPSGKKGFAMLSDDEKTPVPKDSPKKRRGTASKSEERPLKQLSKKVKTGITNGEQSSLRQSDDKKRQSRGKAVLETDAVKSLSKVDKISSLKSDVKPDKDTNAEEETPKAVAKQKHTPGTSKEYGEEIVGKKVKVWWPIDKQFYRGKIDSFDSKKRKHKIMYDDGDVEELILKRQKFEFIGGDLEEEPADEGSPDEEVDMPLKKKVKTTLDQSKKQGKMDALPKQSVGGSSSKAKSASAKSGQKLKESSKTDGQSEEDSKASQKAEDDVGKGKDRPLKTGHKSADVLKSAGKTRGDDVLAMAGKSKEDTSAAKVSKSKQQTPKSGKLKLGSSKASLSPKVKLLKSDVKSNAKDGKLKSGSKNKAREEDKDEDEDSRTVSDEDHEIVKGKVTSSAKGQGNKSSKKRKRGA